MNTLHLVRLRRGFARRRRFVSYDSSAFVLVPNVKVDDIVLLQGDLPRVRTVKRSGFDIPLSIISDLIRKQIARATT